MVPRQTAKVTLTNTAEKQNMKRQKKIKNISLPMKFNPGLHKFEPDLPIKRKGKSIDIKLNWELVGIILGLIILFGFLFFILRNSL